MDKALAAEERRKAAGPHCVHLPGEMPVQRFPRAVLSIEWRNVIFVGSRLAFIIFVLVFIHGVSAGLEELRLFRTGLVEQSTAVRMAIQLQGRELGKNLHSLDVNSTVLIDRFDTVSTHLRGQMTDAAKTVATASKEERRQIVKAIESNAEAQKETPPALLPEIRVVPVVPRVILPPNVQPGTSELVPVPQPSPVAPPENPEVQRKGLWKRLWSSVTKAF